MSDVENTAVAPGRDLRFNRFAAPGQNRTTAIRHAEKAAARLRTAEGQPNGASAKAADAFHTAEDKLLRVNRQVLRRGLVLRSIRAILEDQRLRLEDPRLLKALGMETLESLKAATAGPLAQNIEAYDAAVAALDRAREPLLEAQALYNRAQDLPDGDDFEQRIRAFALETYAVPEALYGPVRDAEAAVQAQLADLTAKADLLGQGDVQDLIADQRQNLQKLHARVAEREQAVSDIQEQIGEIEDALQGYEFERLDSGDIGVKFRDENGTIAPVIFRRDQGDLEVKSDDTTFGYALDSVDLRAQEEGLEQEREALRRAMRHKRCSLRLNRHYAAVAGMAGPSYQALHEHGLSLFDMVRDYLKTVRDEMDAPGAKAPGRWVRKTVTLPGWERFESVSADAFQAHLDIRGRALEERFEKNPHWVSFELCRDAYTFKRMLHKKLAEKKEQGVDMADGDQLDDLALDVVKKYMGHFDHVTETVCRPVVPAPVQPETAQAENAGEAVDAGEKTVLAPPAEELAFVTVTGDGWEVVEASLHNWMLAHGLPQNRDDEKTQAYIRCGVALATYIEEQGRRDYRDVDSMREEIRTLSGAILRDTYLWVQSKIQGPQAYHPKTYNLIAAHLKGPFVEAVQNAVRTFVKELPFQSARDLSVSPALPAPSPADSVA